MMAMLAIATRARFMIYLPLKNNMRRSAGDQPTNAVAALGSKGWLLAGRPDTIPRHTSGKARIATSRNGSSADGKDPAAEASGAKSGGNAHVGDHRLLGDLANIEGIHHTPV